MKAAAHLAWLTTLAVACASSDGASPDAGRDGGAAVPDGGAVGASDGFPQGAISYFLDTGCPSGWSPFADGVGRTIVPAAGDDAGVMVGTPLAANEQRAHRHDLGVEVALPSVSYAGVAGESNHGVARGGTVTGTTAVDDATADLPYAQLLICEKTAVAGPAAVPAGVIAFFAASACPAPWTAAAETMRGRHVVALPSFGVPGATFGGPPLTSGEARSHSHDVAVTVTAASHGIALAGGCCAGGYGAAGAHGATGAVAPTTVDLPYIQLLACVAP